MCPVIHLVDQIESPSWVTTSLESSFFARWLTVNRRSAANLGLFGSIR